MIRPPILRDRRRGAEAALALLLVLALPTAVASASTDRYEPNNSVAAAAGPLLGGQSYEGAIDLAGDSDFFYFFVTSPTTVQASIELKNLGGGGPMSDVDLTVLDSTVTPRASISFLRPGEVGVVELSLQTQKYFVEVTSREEPGDSYQIVTNGSAGAFGSYDVILGKCGAATSSARALREKLSKATVKLQRALNQVRRGRYLGPTARRAAWDRYRKARSVVATTREKRSKVERQRRLWCSIPP